MLKQSGTEAAPQPSFEDDASLLARINTGDEQAISTLFDRYSKPVYSVALRVLNDSSAAENVLHEVFMQLWRTPENFSPARNSLGGWLAVVARNRSIEALRRKRPTLVLEDITLANGFNVANETDRLAVIDRARNVLSRLPSEQRKTLEMAFFDGLSHNEIAEMNGDQAGTVKTRIRSSLLTLRKAFQA